MHLGVDPILVLAPDRDLQLVTRRRELQRAAHVHERLRHGDREPPLEALRLDLGLLAETLRVEHARDREPHGEGHEPAPGSGQFHQKRK